MPGLFRLSTAGLLSHLLGAPLGAPFLVPRPLRPFLLGGLPFAGTPEALFGLVFAPQSLGYALESYHAGPVPPALAFRLGPLGTALGGMGFLLPFPLLLAASPLLGLAVALLGIHLRAVRGWLLPGEGWPQVSPPSGLSSTGPGP